MEREKVYIGYDRNLNRCLLYKKNDKTYIDLEKVKKYKPTEIILGSLISYDKIIEYSISKTKREILKEYLEEENKKLNINDIFIGDIIRVDKVFNVSESENNVDIAPILNIMAYNAFLPTKFSEALIPEYIAFDCEYTPIYQNRLLKRTEDYLGYTYEDLLNGNKYSVRVFLPKKGEVIVSKELTPIRKLYDIDENIESLSKKSIINMHLTGQTEKNSVKINKKEV